MKYFKTHLIYFTRSFIFAPGESIDFNQILAMKTNNFFINFTSSVLMVLSWTPFSIATTGMMNILNFNRKLVKNIRCLLVQNCLLIAVQKSYFVPLSLVFLVAEWSEMCENN